MSATPPISAPPGDARAVYDVACTLAEGTYFYGVAALANSLVRAGFQGAIVVGCRGALPDWLTRLPRAAEPDTYRISESVHFRIAQVGSLWHLNNCKPRFMERILQELYPDALCLYYFDTDIVICHKWQSFAEWAEAGVVLAHDIADGHMSPHHAYRVAWRNLASRQQLPYRDVTGYFNAGCVGVRREYVSLLTVWQRLMEQLEDDGVDMRKMKNPNNRLEFARMDQDVLNAALMASDVPLAVLGPTSMGMYPWIGTVMPHAMLHAKPWRRNYILDALRGFPPGKVHRTFWEFMDAPLAPYGARQLRLKRLQLKIGTIIGLVHMRSYRDL